MEGKELLKEGGVGLAILLAFLYACGINYFLSLFHAYELGVYFAPPLQLVVAEGFSTTIVFLFLAAVLALSGSGARKLFEPNGNHAAKYGSLLLAFSIAIAVLLGLMITYLGRKAGLPALALDGSKLWRLRLLAAVAFPFASLFGFLRFQEESRHHVVGWLAKPKSLHFFGFITVLILLFPAGYYSSLLGKSVVRQIDYRLRARIVFSEENLQKVFGDSWFVPILEQGDDVILVKYAQQERTTPAQSGKIVFLKKAVISSIDYSQ